MNLPIVFALFFLSCPVFADLCNPKSHTFIPIEFPKRICNTNSKTDQKGNTTETSSYCDQLPMYIRVHPSGNYVIASLESEAILIDLNDTEKPRINKTPLKNEAYPIEPSWDYISSPYGEKGMEYYKFEDILKDKENANLVFSDYRHNQYYQSSAEYEHSTPENRHFRTLLFSTLSARDYHVSKNDSGETTIKKNNLVYVCEDVKEHLVLPILSKDGVYMAALSVSSKVFLESAGEGGVGETKIFKLEQNGSCSEVDNLNFGTGKVSFSYPDKNKLGYLSFSANQNLSSTNGNRNSTEAVYLYDRTTKENRLISLPWIEQQAQYPGFTIDGRIIYVTKRGEKSGLVIVDTRNLEQPSGTGIQNIDGPYAVCFENSNSPQAPPYEPSVPTTKKAK